MTVELNRRSYREADVGETYESGPRINSSHNRTTYSRLVQLTDNLNFNSPVFDGMMKRNRSLGSTQAFIVELALADRLWTDENLLPFCIGGGVNVLLGTHYMDTAYFDRLDAYMHRRKRAATPPPAPVPAPTPQQRAYWNKETGRND